MNRGYDTPELYRRAALLHIEQLQREAGALIPHRRYLESLLPPSERRALRKKDDPDSKKLFVEVTCVPTESVIWEFAWISTRSFARSLSVIE